MKRKQSYPTARLILLLFLVFILPSSYVLAVETSTVKDEPGKKLFLDNKCNICHSIQAAAVVKKGPAVAAGAKNPPPDLSGVGLERSADWITKFLKKEVDLNGKKHTKLWTGKPEDLATLAKWLESLKTKPAEKK